MASECSNAGDCGEASLYADAYGGCYDDRVGVCE